MPGYTSKEILAQRLYNATIREREMRRTLALAQQAQTPSSKPTKVTPTTTPAKPVSPTSPQPTQQPAPQPTGHPTRRPVPQPSEAPRYFSSDDTGILVWQTKEYTCLDCGRVIWGADFVDMVLQRGGANGADAGKNIGWLSRADRPDTRCDVCGRKIKGS